jgi:RsiW-degrading membrane proteinase PrsW (M82 family)
VTSAIRILLGLLPVFVFLATLILIDSFKLVRFRSIVQAIVVGCVVAVVCYLINSTLAGVLPLTSGSFSRYVAPLVEELLKAAYLVFLVRTRRVGFMVDSAIFGFAVGAGFAFVENIYYLQALSHEPITAWVVRGFGTAVMHGATTAIFGILGRVLADRWGDRNPAVFLPGLGAAAILHSTFNHFILPPVISTALVLVVFPTIVTIVFNRSERATQNWLGSGLDSELELLDLITSGRISESPVGMFLENLRHRFPDDVVVDILCYMRLHLELALQAKGVLLLRQANLEYSIDPELKAQFDELRFLEGRIGVTGKLAIAPFLRTSSRDLWQIYMLDTHSSSRS